MTLKPANPKPCAACPWRTANQGTRHPHGFYTKANLRRLWAGLRRGERMSCHPTDSRMCEFEGYEDTAERAVMHECAGSLVLIQREVQRVADALEADAKDGLRTYRREHPRGLTKEGAYTHMMAAMLATNPISGLHARHVNLNDQEIGHPDLVPWQSRPPRSELRNRGVGEFRNG